MIVEGLSLIATIAMVSALIWVRFAFVSLNQDLRMLLARQADTVMAFEEMSVSFARLEKRIRAIEDEVL
jgi:hypothetical protein